MAAEMRCLICRRRLFTPSGGRLFPGPHELREDECLGLGGERCYRRGWIKVCDERDAARAESAGRLREIDKFIALLNELCAALDADGVLIDLNVVLTKIAKALNASPMDRPG